MTVTALDDYTVECVLPGPFAPFLRSMGTAIYPQHILEKHVDDGSFTDTWNIDTDPAEIIGTGAVHDWRLRAGRSASSCGATRTTG